jgi:hypothetical protein
MPKVAKARFVVRAPGGALATFAPGDELPTWVEELITNPAVVEASETASEPEVVSEAPEALEAPETAAEDASPDEFDPADHTVKQVLQYLDGVDDDEARRVIAAEHAGRARRSIVRSDLMG